MPLPGTSTVSTRGFAASVVRLARLTLLVDGQHCDGGAREFDGVSHPPAMEVKKKTAQRKEATDLFINDERSSREHHELLQRLDLLGGVLRVEFMKASLTYWSLNHAPITPAIDGLDAMCRARASSMNPAFHWARTSAASDGEGDTAVPLIDVAGAAAWAEPAASTSDCLIWLYRLAM